MVLQARRVTIVAPIIGDAYVNTAHVGTMDALVDQIEISPVMRRSECAKGLPH